MTAKTNQRWLLAARPVGALTENNFQWREEPVRDLEAGEVLVRNVYLSLDPASRGWVGEQESYVEPVAIGAVMRGIAVGVVEESRSEALAAGDVVQGLLGWQTYCTGTAPELTKLPPLPIPLTAVLGVLGHIGASAYFGLLDVGKPRPGETVVVSAAAGAVGSLVGQLAKQEGCRVVGIAGTAEKCAWLTGELGFDAAVSYKEESFERALRTACPDGVDVYFDNVGGRVSDAVLALINLRARVVLCGQISMYNAVEPVAGPRNYVNILIKRARVEGFIVTDYLPRFSAAAIDLGRRLAAGTLKYRVDVVDGLRNAPTALGRLFDGTNTGKLIIRVSAEPTSWPGKASGS